MPVRKKLSYKAIIEKLLASNLLSIPEQIAFTEMACLLYEGRELTEHQMLWVEALKTRTEV